MTGVISAGPPLIVNVQSACCSVHVTVITDEAVIVDPILMGAGRGTRRDAEVAGMLIFPLTSVAVTVNV